MSNSKQLFSISEKSNINESTLLNSDDIYYNKEKFDNNEINICFITGHSGSGKTTMASNMTKNKNNIEHYQIDDVLSNWNFSDENLKEYGDLIYSFFKKSGKKIRCKSVDEAMKIPDYDKEAVTNFVKYSISYAKSHKNTSFIIEGVQIFQWFSPSTFKDYAVCIKGTSRLVSAYRAAKRDASYDAKNKLDEVKILKTRFMNDLKFGKDFERRINEFRKYFLKLIEENKNESAIDLKLRIYESEMNGYITEEERNLLLQELNKI